MLNVYRAFWVMLILSIMDPGSVFAQNQEIPYDSNYFSQNGTPHPIPSDNSVAPPVAQPQVLEKEASLQDPNDSKNFEWIQPKPVPEVDKSPLDTQIIKIFQSPSVLSEQERETLSELIGKMKQSSLSETSLKKVSDHLVIRVDSDIQSLRVLLESVEALSKDRFGRTVAKIQEKEIKRLWNQFEELSSQIQESRPRYGKLDKVSRKQYWDSIARHSSFCVENFSSVPALFERIKQVVKPAYDQWNKKYSSMGFDGQESDSDNINKPIQYEERKFAQVFARVQILFRRLTEVNSDKF